ncbi:hypothetical protein M2132_001819 [Dysgonomonas sp. PH5-45]|uniref:hypothetical protein n=1 Tax=unclassified Dysgonomonas TaxID=2630389 RepID=UPI0024736508|nr:MULTISPECIES: hypothetical protein [unclassified Dysgonomonas]MDH6355476.1 hypothetical protein [Dysgonomonas sp. PH5-45]MDH6388372.1 hypothetical protein [Dysgonomonas sp. PH5-37]
MRKVRIEYTKLFFFKKNKEIYIPDKWEELSERQFAICAKLYSQPVPDDIFLSEFYGIKKSLAHRLSKFEQYKLIECAGFVSDPKQKINYFFLKSIPGTFLVSPEPRLKDISFEQFMLFDTFFFDYMNDPQEYILRKFVACIYTAKGECTSDFDFEQRMEYLLKKVDTTTMYAIFLNYTFIRKWLSGAFPFLFEYKEDNRHERKQPSVKDKTPSRPNWNAILDGLIGDDILNEEKYRKIKCIRAFKTINNRIKNYNHGKR